MGMTLNTGDASEPILEINTTPLIDVMLVLLIMLIVTIPVQLHSVNMDLPRAAAAHTPTPPVLRVQVLASGAVSWNGQVLPDAPALAERMAQAAAAVPEPQLHIHAEPSARYGAVAAVLAAAQRAGVKRLGVMPAEAP